jgi:hypothetical protein
MWTEPVKGLEKKRMIERELYEMEVFVESTVTVLIMTTLLWGYNSRENEKLLDDGSNLLYFAYVTSIVSASLGLAKSLKMGPCRILSDQGPAGGVLTGRFFLLVVSMVFTLIAKGSALANGMSDTCKVTADQLISRSINQVLFPIATCFLPGFLLGVLALGPSLRTLKLITSHPSLVLLPSFTFFTFSSGNSCFGCKKGDSRIAWSWRWTLLNLLISFIGNIVVGVVTNSCRPYSMLTVYPVMVVLVSMLTTGLFMLSCSCCCSCCALCCCPAFQLSALRPEDPLIELVIVNEGGEEKLVKVMRKGEDEVRVEAS